MLNHIFERAWPGYPADRAPVWAAWMTYGRFAVVMFIALPGFSNRAFWSIAIEAQLYVLLPLLLLVRRVSARAMVGLVVAIVVTIGLLGPHGPPEEQRPGQVHPDLAVLFAVGLLAAGIATSRPRPVVRFLDSLLPRSLSSCSYSLGLTHRPIVIAVSYGLVLGRIATGTPTFFVLAAILLPVPCFARLFALCSSSPSSGTTGGLCCDRQCRPGCGSCGDRAGRRRRALAER